MKRILIVDDDADILDALETMLTMENFGVTISTTGNSLLKIDGQGAPDVIILDVFLSGHDGRLLCQQIKKQEKTKNIPVIMISAHPDMRASVLKSGADDFLAKPFDSDELVNKIHNLLPAKRLFL